MIPLLLGSIGYGYGTARRWFRPRLCMKSKAFWCGFLSRSVRLLQVSQSSCMRVMMNALAAVLFANRGYRAPLNRASIMLGAGAAYILNPDVLGVSFVDAHFVGDYVRLHSRICAFACVNIGECKLAWREALGSNAYYRLLIRKVFFQSCALLGDGMAESAKRSELLLDFLDSRLCFFKPAACRFPHELVGAVVAGITHLRYRPLRYRKNMLPGREGSRHTFAASTRRFRSTTG